MRVYQTYTPMAEIQQGSDNDGKKIRRKKASTRIDMTPMVDLAFLLLTFFMLTTSLLDPPVIEIEKASDNETQSGPSINENNVVTILLSGDNKIYWYRGITNPKVYRSDYSGSGIRKILFAKKKEIAGLHILIKPGDQSRYKNMVDILDELIITEIKNYSLVKMTPVDRQLIAKSNL